MKNFSKLLISSAYVIELSGREMASRKRRLNIGSIDTLFEDRPNLNQSNRDIHDFKSKSDGQDDFLISTVEEYNRKQRNEIQQVLDDGCDDILNASYVEAMNADREQQNAAPVPKKMNSKSKIERNRLQAIIRRINRGPSGQRKYDYVSEYFWHVEEWPTYAIKALLSKSFNYTERLQLASFLLGNGLRETEIATQFVKLYDTHWNATSLWQKRLLEFGKLFAYMDKPINDPDRANIRARYFYYNMQTEKTMFLNGMRRNRNGEAVEFNL